MSDPAPPPVSSRDRARLRPSVDVAALERLIAQQPLSARSLTLLAFYAQPTAGEVLTALLAAGADEAALSTLRAFAAYAALPPHLAHPENDPDPTWMAPVWAVDRSRCRATGGAKVACALGGRRAEARRLTA